MLHKHHIIPKHANGTDDPWNLIHLTVAEHALAHKKLWEEFGRYKDYLAWQGLSGQINQEEIFYKIVKSPEFRQKCSIGQTGSKNSQYGKIPWNKGKIGSTKFTKEQKAKISSSLKGRKKSLETRLKMSLAKKGKNNPMSKEKLVTRAFSQTR